MSDTTQKPDGIEWAGYGRKTLDTLVTWKGETKTIPQWARIKNTTAKNLHHRLKIMPLDRAMTPELDNVRRGESIRKAVRKPQGEKNKKAVDTLFNKFVFGTYKHEKQNNA